MSKLSHSNPYLDDVYVDGDEYRFENGGVYVKPEPDCDMERYSDFECSECTCKNGGVV